MPRELEERLKRSADRKGISGDRKNAYVYGTLNRIEAKRKRKGKT